MVYLKLITRLKSVSYLGWRSRVIGAVVLAVATVGMFLVGCSKATKPRPAKYNIYLGASYWKDSTDVNSLFSQMYVYDADSLTRLDSIPLPAPSWEMAASPDGRWLYVSFGSVGDPQSQGNVIKINAITHQTVWQSPDASFRIGLIKNGQLLVNGSRVLRTSDGTTVRRYNDSYTLGGGAPSGTKVALIAEARVRIADVETGEISGDFGPNIGTGSDCPVYAATLHPDEERVIVIAVDTTNLSYWFVIGNVLTGETLLWDRMFSPNGQLEISADGKTGVCTDPGRPFLEETPMGIDILDLANCRPLKRLDYRNGLPVAASGQARFLPGDRRLVVAPRAGAAGGPLCIVNLESLTVTDITLLSDRYVIKRSLGVGPRPD